MKLQAQVLRVGEPKEAFACKDGLDRHSMAVDLAVLRHWETMGEEHCVKEAWDKIRVEYIKPVAQTIHFAEGDGVEADVEFDLVESKNGGQFQNIKCAYIRKIQSAEYERLLKERREYERVTER